MKWEISKLELKRILKKRFLLKADEWWNEPIRYKIESDFFVVKNVQKKLKKL